MTKWRAEYLERAFKSNRYCSKCGKEMVLHTESGDFDSKTGKRVYKYSLTCSTVKNSGVFGFIKILVLKMFGIEHDLEYLCRTTVSIEIKGSKLKVEVDEPS